MIGKCKNRVVILTKFRLYTNFRSLNLALFFNYRVIQKKGQLTLKSAFFHGMSWKYGFYIIQGRGIRIWNRISDISIASLSKLRLKSRKKAKNQFVRFYDIFTIFWQKYVYTLIWICRIRFRNYYWPFGTANAQKSALKCWKISIFNF